MRKPARQYARRPRGRAGSALAILSENRIEYREATYAAAKLGAILCALNWRLAEKDIAHCVDLGEPLVVLVSPRFEAAYRALGRSQRAVAVLGPDYERRLAMAPAGEPELAAEPEDGLLILYTSSPTGASGSPIAPSTSSSRGARTSTRPRSSAS